MPMPVLARALRAAALILGLAVLTTLWALGPRAASAATVRGDFDGDGFADLAIGAPSDSVAGRPGAGAVNVIYGSGRGLRAAHDQELTAADPGLPDDAQPFGAFGAALATGDVDGDGYADLAVGAPGTNLGTPARPVAGAISVFYGSPSGLGARSVGTRFSQDTAGVAGRAEAGDAFGGALAVGDFDGDGHADVAAGARGDSVSGQQDAGAVNVLYGTPGGLRVARNQLWTQDTAGIKGLAGQGHQFGFVLAAGDLSRNGRDELAIGIPGGVISGHPGAGAISVLHGRRGGLSSVDQLWSQDARGILGHAETNDRFGQALAIGDFDGDGDGDLAVGAPSDSVNGARGAGAVTVLRGSDRGLTRDGNQLWTQDSPSIRGVAAAGALFGSALVAGDLSRNGADELIVGVPGEVVGGRLDAGAVAVLYGSRGSGLGTRANQLWTLDSGGIKGVAGASDAFGSALAVADFDHDGALDVAAGAPFADVGGFPDAGAVSVFHGSGRGLRGRDQRWTQARSGVQGAVGDDRFGGALAGGRG
jgi:hypothetical protein